MGKGIVEKLKNEYDLEIEWIGYELHPEIPPEGMLLRRKFPGIDLKAMFESLNRAGAPYGIAFNPRETVANSRLALEAAEFARDTGKFEEADDRLFRAYFQDGLNIGEKGVVLRVLKEIGVDEHALSDALDNRVYGDRLERARERGQENKIVALPTYIINGEDKIVGAQPYIAYTRCLNVYV